MIQIYLLLIFSMFLGSFACSNSDFSGVAPMKDSNDSPSASEDDDDGSKDDEDDFEIQVGKITEALYGDDATLKIDPCVPVDTDGGFIDFENLGSSGAVAENEAVSDQFEATLGVKFSFVSGGAPVLAKIGPPETAFYCDEGCATTADGVLPGVPVGLYFLTDDGVNGGALPAANRTLVVQYTTATSEFSFDLIDLDGTEAWELTAFDADDKELVKKTYASTSFLYKNGDIEKVKISSDTRNIVKFQLKPVAGAGNFGVAFDNFSPHGICE